MTALDGVPEVARRSVRRGRGTHATRSTLIAAVGTLAVALVADRWYAARAAAHARAEVRATAAVHAEALRSSTTRELSLLLALVSFTESRRTRAELDAEFPTFARGVFSEQGLRALQLVEAGRIVHTWPLEGNEAAIGYDLTMHPDARVRADFERARTSEAVTITGPIALVQGGVGLLVRQRIASRPGFPDLAAVILDVPRLVAAAGIPDPTTGLRMELRDRSGRWFSGDREGSAAAPESLAVATPDGDFRLLAAPVEGWAARTAPSQRRWRGGMALLVVLASVIGGLVGRRRDRLEAEMTRSSTALRLVMGQLRMGGWEEDLVSGSIRWNAAMGDLIGPRVSADAAGLAELIDLIDPLDRERFRAALAGARAGRTDEFIEEVRVGGAPHAGGRWLLVVGSVTRGTAGMPTRLTCVMADAGEQRALEERLRHAQRLEALAKLASGVAHDFTDVLSAVLHAATSARERAGGLPESDSASVREDIDHVIATAHRGSRLTEQLFSFSRGWRSDAPPLDVVAGVTELVPTLERLVGSHLRIVHDSPPGPLWVRLDGGQFAQVLINLVVNARDAMPSGGTIRVRARLLDALETARPVDAPPGRWALIEVQDEGTGIPDAVRERIFEPYFTTKTEGRGTGLGLSVVIGIVEAAGGSVTVSTAHAQGTTFHLFLPADPGGPA